MMVLETLSRLFPPPNFLRLPSAGVDISDTSLKYIQFLPEHHGDDKLRLKLWGDIDIPDGVLARGEVLDNTKLAEVLKDFKSRTGIEYVRVSLPEERAYLFETYVDKKLSHEEIRNQLEFRLEENVPLSPRDAYFDYHIFDHHLDSNKLVVSVTAYARETINTYYEACRAAGLTPLAFEVEAQAIARASLPEGDKGTHLIIDFGKTRTGIGIVHHGILMYTSTIDIGGKELSTALRRQLGERPETELTEIKNTQGLVRRVDDNAAYEALVTTMSAIKDEIAVRIQYWNNRDLADQDRFITSIILCGGSANLKGLPEYLAETLQVTAKRASVWQNAFDIESHVPPIGLRYSYGYATAIGLALAPYQNV